MAKKAAAPPFDTSCRILILCGKEPFLRAEYTRLLRGMLEKERGEVQTLRFDGAAAEPADILDELRSPGLMPVYKMAVVDEADQLVKDASRPIFERYAESPSEHGVLVLRADTWRPGKLDKLVEKVGAVVKCEPLEPAKAANWVATRCMRRHGVDIEPRAARLLVERLGAGLGRLDSEMARLAAQVGPGATITLAMVEEQTGVSRQEDQLWEIQDHLLGADPQRALDFIRLALGNAPRDTAVPLVYACMDLARKINSVRRGGRPKMWPQHRAQAIRSAAGRLSEAAAADLLAAAVDTDRAMKTGRGDSHRLLESLAVRFTSALGG
jgi:DNA polymerase-3 subunit delta